VVEYSGYAAADPDNPQPSTLIVSALGFATVGVNMRGSGCSGGVLDLFDFRPPPTATTSSRRSPHSPGSRGARSAWWAYPSQASASSSSRCPPTAPGGDRTLSVIADIYRAPGFPGHLNSGFAQTWLQERNGDSRPAPEGGQAYAVKRGERRDATCLANQQLRLQTLDAVEFTQSHPYYVPDLMDQRSPINWVRKIAVPTFLASAFQDEQTGGDFASMLSRLPKRRDVKITVTNGVHTSSLDPTTLWNWLAFLDLYVAERVPDQSRLAPIAPLIYLQILGAGAPTPPLPPTASPTLQTTRRRSAASKRTRTSACSWRTALARRPPGYRPRRSSWPSASGLLRSAAGGLVLRTRRDSDPARPSASDDGVDGYHPDPDARPAQTLPGQGQEQSWEVIPHYDWRPLVDGTAVAYATPPLVRDTIVGGPGSVDLWLRSSAADADLQVTLTEVRPDGLEAYVQNGWLRASHRKLDRKTSTVLAPRPTHLERDAAPSRRAPSPRSGLGCSRGARVPSGLAHPYQHRGARWRPHALGPSTRRRRTAGCSTRSPAPTPSRRASCSA